MAEPQGGPGATPLAGGTQHPRPGSRAAAMHIPESLQDLADSEAVQFLKKPKTITRICAGIFALIIFSSLLTDGYQNKTDSSQLHCVLNSNNTACSFSVGAGLLAFLCCLAFLVLDAHESRIASTHFKSAFQLLDFILAVLWTAVWFVGFCFLANQWQHSPPKHFLLGSSSAKVAVTFAFFSILIWIFQAYLALQDLQNDAPVPYKRSLDERGMVLTSLSPPSAASPVNTPSPDPHNLSYTGSSLSPYLSTPKVPRLAMMPDD
ncbi:synaptogyrin-4 isoform X1 [Equus caballus]|uniref:synaptogyrin-4 isoform X1 n=1 Tax=Equus caballus TaxID=9796 RepID=UPI000C9E48D8|nr:synaptogyrin-4 isoform X2 [Equus caballus]